jgi:hypothetical protein
MPDSASNFSWVGRSREIKMPSQYGTATYWLTAAANARALAFTLDDEAARTAMREVAAELEKIARRANDLETKAAADNLQRKAG